MWSFKMGKAVLNDKSRIFILLVAMCEIWCVTPIDTESLAFYLLEKQTRHLYVPTKRHGFGTGQ